MKKFLSAIFLSSLFAASFVGEATAGFTSISLSPSSKNISSNTPAVFTVTWTPMRAAGVGNKTVTSPSIVIRLGDSNGPILHTITKSLTKTQQAQNFPIPYVFSEAVNIPRDVVYRATKAGQPLVVQRIFTDQSDALTITGELPVNVSGGMSSDFSISQIGLSFEDGSASCVTSAGKAHTAIANIVASGTGILRGSWQVRTGGGLGSFRTLRTIQAPVSGNTVIQSPALPNVNPGEIMEVRIAVESPSISFLVPSISCGATGGNRALKGSAQALKLATVTSPAQNSPLNSESEIKWEAVKGAKSYRVEILVTEDGEPVAAQLVKPDKTSASLSPLTLDKLNKNGRYRIRVVAE